MNISITHYHDLIESISAGQYWIQSTFNLTVTTGFILGDYIYPSSLLEVLKQAGLTHLVIHHMASNSPYYDSTNPLRHLFAEGGVDSDSAQPSLLFIYGKIPLRHPHIFESRTLINSTPTSSQILSIFDVVAQIESSV